MFNIVKLKSKLNIKVTRILALLCVVALLFTNIFPFNNPTLKAATARTITKSSTADWNQGSNSNLNTTGNEIKMSPNAKMAWYNSSWSYRQKITLDHTKVPNTDQTDFPVLIKITDVGNPIFTNAKDDGTDIHFTSEDETTKINREIEYFSKANHELVAWVKISNLYHLYDTIMYMYYGNPAAEDYSAAEKQAVWSNGFVGVWHMSDISSSTVKDSSSNNLGGNKTSANLPLEVAGKIGKAQSYSANSVISTSAFSMGLNFTICFWSNPASSAVKEMVIHGNVGSGAFELYQNGTSATLRGGSATPSVTGAGALQVGNWKYACGTIQNTTGTVYSNSSYLNSGTVAAPSGSSRNLNIGAYSNLQFPFNGMIDEVRVSSQVRLPDWIATEYNNQNSPETFFSLGSEVSYNANLVSATASGWYNTDWKYRRKLTVDHTKVPNTNQTEFPVLVKMTEATDPIFSKAQSDGDDILFADKYGNIKLAHEIERFDTSSKELIAWVKLPTLSTSTDTVIYMYYGNSGVETQESVSAVWSNGFVGVWHSEDATSSVIADSVTGVNNGVKIAVNEPIESDGKIGKAQNYDGSNDNVNMGDLSSIDSATTLTLTSWMKTDNTDQDDDISAKVTGHGTNQPLLLWRDDVVGGGDQINNTDALSILVFDGDTMSWSASPSGTLNDTNWHYTGFTFTANVLGGLKPYVDGVNVNSASTINCNYIQPTANNFVVGAPTAASNGISNFDGSIDELRVATSVRSADWIATEYNNQNSPVTFLSTSNEETYYPISDSASWYSSNWNYRQKITIDHTKVPNTDQEGFPVLIKITDPANGIFEKAQTDGDDILFTNSTGTAKLSHEIERFSTILGDRELVAWVKTDLSHITDTVLYMYYGNTGVESQESVADTWNLNYKGVWHGNDATSNTINDSTVNTNNGTKRAVGEPVETNGKNGKAQYYDGSNDYIDIGDKDSLEMTEEITISGWFYLTQKLNNWAICKWVSGAQASNAYLFIPHYSSGGVPNFFTSYNSVSSQFSFPSTLQLDTWYYLSATFDQGAVNVFVNGSSVRSGSMPNTTITSTGSYPLVFGQASNKNNTAPFKGNIDDIFISNTARSADWIATEYNNQNDPGSFFSLSQEHNTSSYASPVATSEGSGILDTIWNGGWQTPTGFSANVNIPAGTSLKFEVRSSAVGGTTDADWTNWATVGVDSTAGAHEYTVATGDMPAITLGTNRYLQFRSFLISNDGIYSTGTPTLSDFTVHYLADETAAVNPDTIAANLGGDGILNQSWFNSSGTVNLIFSGATDADSGVAGYYVYCGTSSTADPYTLGNYQAHSGALGADQYFNEVVGSEDDGKHYYVRIITKDVAGNRSTAQTLYEFGYDNTIPTRPSFVAASPEGYTTTNSFSFSWPAGTDPAGASGASGIKWYEYKRATDLVWSHTADANTRSVASIEAYQEGANAFYVRTVDLAGNASSDYQQVTYYWSGEAPPKPTSLTISPDPSDENDLTISWQKTHFCLVFFLKL